VEYFAFGEVFVEEHKNSHNSPYKFNGKELDEESGYTYFGARYLDMRHSMWNSTDPLSGYNPIFEKEHYIDGKHNLGVFNSFNHNTYGYCYQNPVNLVDPNGKQALPGAIIGAFTEYLSIIGSRMFFEDKTFKEANAEWGWKDTGNVTISFLAGGFSGTAKFAKFMSSSVGKRIMKEVLTSAVESFIKLTVELLVDQRGMKSEDAEKLIVGTLIEFGIGKLIPDFAKKNLEEAENAAKYYKNKKYWKAKDAENTKKAAEALNDFGKVTKETTKKSSSKKTDKIIEKKNKS
jgi:RHS repeat-associated protein